MTIIRIYTDDGRYQELAFDASFRAIVHKILSVNLKKKFISSKNIYGESIFIRANKITCISEIKQDEQ